ncbi:MAG: SAF domain-containing protein [Actinomycetota bacterium]
MAATVRGERREAGVGDDPFDLASADVNRPRSRLPEVLVGTLLVAVFALAGAWFYSTSTARVGYLAFRQNVDRGDVVERADLIVYQVATDAPIVAMRASELDEIVGKVALVDLRQGTLATAQHVAEAADILPGWGVVGLDLGPGEIPSFSLRPGDRVRVVDVGDASSDGPTVLAEAAEIVEVAQGNGRGLFIAVTLEAAPGDRVVVAAARGDVRLVQVPEG